MPGQERALFNLPALFFISLGFLLSPAIASQIPLGSKISVEENNYWVSSNGDFAFGFFNRSNQFSVGIRFNSRSISTDKQQFVWFAGADLTVGDQSYFQLTQNGELIVFDSKREVIAWTSNTTNSYVASAVLGDNGNLVLLNRDKGIVWQSFNTPSNTLLPGQNLSTFQTLRAASRNCISSYYSLSLSGQLQLRWESDVLYWTSGGSPSVSKPRAILGSDGTLQLLDERSKPIWSVFGEDHNDANVKFRFLRLDVDGNLRLYSWVQFSSSWRSVWQAIGNECNVFATCGLRGICMFNSSGSPVCKCPFVTTSESTSKCLVPYGTGCESGSSLVTYEHTSLYGIYPPKNETITHTSLQQCKNSCQLDPLCMGATFTNDGTAQCQMMKTQYISGQSDPTISSISFVKRCSDPIAVIPIIPKSTSSPSQNSQPKQPHNFSVPRLIEVAGATFVVFIVIQFGIGLCIYRKRKCDKLKASSSYASPNPNGLVVFTYVEIEELTENFKHQIGRKTFKGMLSNNRPVAVKGLNSTLEERKFRCAVLKLGSISHKGLVKLEGYCCDSGHRFLVYEFEKNSSVDKCLDNPKMCKRLTWRKRMEIFVSVARAILYLHTGCREFISHGNLKCQNVVLGSNLEAKVSEFGLYSFVGEASSDDSGSGAGDVRDFGNMVVELVSGPRSSDEVEWVYEKWLEGRSQEVVDNRIEGGVDPNELERSLRIAFMCLQDDERMRPSMEEVVKVLEGTLAVDPPPHPFACQSVEEEE